MPDTLTPQRTRSQILARYEEHLTGLPYPVIVLDAAEEINDPSDGIILGIAIPDAEELAAAVALALCQIPIRLKGAEVRFIRHVLGMSAQDLAVALAMDPATLSRWENGKQEIGAWADKAVRMAAVLRLRDRAPGGAQAAEGVVMLRLHPRPPDVDPAIEARRIAPSGTGGAAQPHWDAQVSFPSSDPPHAAREGGLASGGGFGPQIRRRRFRSQA